MIYLIINLILWLFPIFIPFNESFFLSLNLTYYIPIQVFWMIYVLGIISLSILISHLVKLKKFNYDYLFWFCTLWLFNVLTFIYFSCFESITLCKIFSLLELINLGILIKKINKGLTKYLFLFVLIYLYLLYVFF